MERRSRSPALIEATGPRRPVKGTALKYSAQPSSSVCRLPIEGGLLPLDQASNCLFAFNDSAVTLGPDSTSRLFMGDPMSEPNHDGSADQHIEQTEMLIGRREVVGETLMRFAKYTAPAMLVVLMSSAGAKAACSPCE
jgi:hypothetical protein